MKADRTLDCFGLLCPMPIIQAARAVRAMDIGQVLEITATDPGVKDDLPAWCRTTGQEFLGFEQDSEVIKVYLRKRKEID
jgi:tRNA 2-thiouridine synthesizing protein A